MNPEVASALIACVGVFASALISYWISHQIYVRPHGSHFRLDGLRVNI